MKAKMLFFLVLMVLPALACAESEEEDQPVRTLAAPTTEAQVTEVPPTEVPPAEAPSTETLPTEALPTASPPTEVPPTALPVAWVSGYDSCPSSAEYGNLIVDVAHLYSSREIGPATMIARVPHGTQVELLEGESDGLVGVRFEGKVGYIQSMLIVLYDPKDGVQPNESACL